MRKILLLITDLEIGGTPTVVRELAVRLNDVERGLVVEVACLAPWGPVADDLRGRGIVVHALAATTVRDLTVVLRLISLIRRGGYDTVFSFLIHANAVAALASWFVSFRLIQSVQTTQARPRWHWWVQRRVWKRAEKVVAPSRSAGEFAQKRAGVSAGKIVVIPNAVEMGEFSRSSIPAAAPTPYPIGFIGRLDPIKRVPFLVRSLKQVKSAVQLHVFGEGRDRTEIVAAIRAHGLERVVTLHGAVRRPQEALEKIGLLVLPSAAEGFGLVLIEAMAAGVPVVATDVPGIRDVVWDGETGLLVGAEDEAGLAGAIDRVIWDGELRRGLIENGLVDVTERFTWERILPAYRKLLEVDAPGTGRVPVSR